MTLYETIFKRRAVRKYTKELLPDEILAKIKTRFEGLKQLDGQQAKFEIVSDSAINNGKAPYYIYAYCENSAKDYINAGYCLQEMDLYIQSIGLGSLWLGTAKPKEKETAENYCIMLAFGKTDIPLRQSAGDFSRLEINKISNDDNEISRAARLAPSAMNSQPWRLTFDKETVLIEYSGRGLLKGILKKKFSKIDMGIISKHIELALIENGKTITAVSSKSNDKDFSVHISYKA